MLFINNYDKNSLAALTNQKDKVYFDGLAGKVITVGLCCGVMHTGVLTGTLSDGIKILLLFPPEKGGNPFNNRTYEYIFYRAITSVQTTCFTQPP